MENADHPVKGRKWNFGVETLGDRSIPMYNWFGKGASRVKAFGENFSAMYHP